MNKKIEALLAAVKKDYAKLVLAMIDADDAALRARVPLAYQAVGSWLYELAETDGGVKEMLEKHEHLVLLVGALTLLFVGEALDVFPDDGDDFEYIAAFARLEGGLEMKQRHSATAGSGAVSLYWALGGVPEFPDATPKDVVPVLLVVAETYAHLIIRDALHANGIRAQDIDGALAAAASLSGSEANEYAAELARIFLDSDEADRFVRIASFPAYLVADFAGIAETEA